MPEVFSTHPPPLEHHCVCYVQPFCRLAVRRHFINPSAARPCRNIEAFSLRYNGQNCASNALVFWDSCKISCFDYFFHSVFSFIRDSPASRYAFVQLQLKNNRLWTTLAKQKRLPEGAEINITLYPKTRAITTDGALH